MSGTSSAVEWVETTEEVVITEECVAPESNTPGAGMTKVLRIPVVLLVFISEAKSLKTLFLFNQSYRF